jgi:hypothetical protein
MSFQRSSFIVFITVFAAGGCASLGLRSRSNAPDAERTLTGFDAVEITGAVSAEIVEGPAFAVTLGAERAAEARVNGETLVVTAARPASAAARGGVTVRISMPVLRRLQVAGARVVVKGTSAPRLEIAAREAAVVNLEGTRAARLVIEARGSRMVVAGESDSVQLALAEASRVDARALKVRTAKVSLAGASRLDLRPDRLVSGNATGASMLAVWSQPKRVKVATRDRASVSYVR